eukprot:gnl/Chilomastix_cuspidata/4976.p1 GENE.gnl/Chilomastix_cuspidata/4976~~gnl/Chilomastix_cuspidata/4976.p1  ORF type:complete len:619 (-),score=203.94 gnl/Chilomastix_cuspidata/4976:28-1704(-)
MGLSVQDVDFAIITHFHLDHSGSIPYLMSHHNFTNPVFTSKTTVSLLPSALSDYMKLTDSYRKRAEPFAYTPEIIHRTCKQLCAVNIRQKVQVKPGVSITFLPAGHVIGAVQVYVEAEEGTVFYSGDTSIRLNSNYPPALPRSLEAPIDLALFETTYCSVITAPQEPRRALLLSAIVRTILRRRPVLISEFSLGGFQETCLMMDLAWMKANLQLVPLYATGGFAEQTTSQFISRSVDAHTYFPSWEGKASQYTLKNFHRFSSKITEAADDSPWVLVATPGQLRAGTTLDVFHYLAPQKGALALFSGHSTRASSHWRIQRGVVTRFKADHSITEDIRCTLMNSSFIRHVDFVAITSFLKHLRAANVLLIHGTSNATNACLPHIRQLVQSRPIGEYFPAPGRRGDDAGPLPRVEILTDVHPHTRCSRSPFSSVVELIDFKDMGHPILFVSDSLPVLRARRRPFAACLSCESPYSVIFRLHVTESIMAVAEILLESFYETNLGYDVPPEKIRDIDSVQVLGTSVAACKNGDATTFICAIEDYPIVKNIQTLLRAAFPPRAE